MNDSQNKIGIENAQRNETIDVNHENDQSPKEETDTPLLLKSIGFNLDYYDKKTNMAGDIRFTKDNLFHDQIWSDFGQQDIRSPNDPTKRNVQPTVILPLGTKVYSLVDGEVINVEKLYSNDYTIMVARNRQSNYIYETEHVIHPLVKVGDHVSGGEVIAEASDHNSDYHPGLGILEIGILHPTKEGVAQHICPFAYLDPSIKKDVENKLNALYAAWESYQGNTTIYDEDHMVSPGCVITDPVQG